MTTYTKQERKAIAEMFKAARKILWDGKPGTEPDPFTNPFNICRALHGVVPEEFAGYWAIREAQGIISHRLGNCLYATHWLTENGADYEEVICNTRRVQKWRKEWLRRLEKEFSS